jgi:hypothetical protein
MIQMITLIIIYFCRITSILLTLIFSQQLPRISQCYFEEFTNLTVQFLFLATITHLFSVYLESIKIKTKIYSISNYINLFF